MSALWEGVFQIVVETLIDGGWRLFGEPLVQRARAQPAVAGCVLFFFGGVAAFLFSLILPARIMPEMPVPGASVLLSPFVAGLAMARYGQWLEARGTVASFTATFWGGALFAAGMASARFLLVQR